MASFGSFSTSRLLLALELTVECSQWPRVYLALSKPHI